MKLLSFFLTVFLLWSCSSTDETEINNDPIEVVGEIKYLGDVLVGKKADFLLTDTNGEVYYVYSQFLDLNKFAIDDVLYSVVAQPTDETDSGTQILVIKNITPFVSEPIDDKSKPNLPDFVSDSEFGFSIEVPQDTIHVRGDNFVKFSLINGDVVVSRYYNTSSLPTVDWLNANGHTDYTQVLIGVDQIKGYKVASTSSLRYFFGRSTEYIYEITLPNFEDGQNAEFLSALNSFRFLPIAEEPAELVTYMLDGWRLFESNPYKFSIKYPNNFYVLGNQGVYLFNDSDDFDTHLVKLSVINESKSTVLEVLGGESAEKTSMNNLEVYEFVKDDVTYYVFTSKNSSYTFSLEGGEAMADTLKKMLSSFTSF